MKKTIPVALGLACLIFAACVLYSHHHKQPLVDDYGQELTPIADVGIETTFLDLFDNCVLPNGEPETWESLDPRKTSINVPSYEKVKPTFPLLLVIHENKQLDILYDIFLVRGNNKANQDMSIYDMDKPYVMPPKIAARFTQEKNLAFAVMLGGVILLPILRIIPENIRHILIQFLQRTIPKTIW